MISPKRKLSPSAKKFALRTLAFVLLFNVIFTSAILPAIANAQAAQNNNNQVVDVVDIPPAPEEIPREQVIEPAQQAEVQEVELPELLVEADMDPQAKAALSTTDTSQAQSAQNKIAADTLSCTSASILAGVLASAISAAISELIGSVVGDEVKKQVTGKNPVPTEEVGPLLDNKKLDTHAKTGVAGPFGLYLNVSWDSIAWCIVNAMIAYIADSTIAWAKSGFNGNPAFIQNPERFFSDLADQTAGTVIKNIAYGATGVNVCEPFKVTVALGLAQGYQGQGSNYLDSQMRGLSCRLSDISQGRFFGGVDFQTKPSSVTNNGNILLSDWINVTQHEENNPYGTYIKANQALYGGVQAKQNEIRFEVGMNNGWLNFKKCKDESNPKSCDIVTPGKLIESQLNSTLDQEKQRLVMADKFDQLITVIVEALIKKIALNTIFDNEQ